MHILDKKCFLTLKYFSDSLIYSSVTFSLELHIYYSHDILSLNSTKYYLVFITFWVPAITRDHTFQGSIAYAKALEKAKLKTLDTMEEAMNISFKTSHLLVTIYAFFSEYCLCNSASQSFRYRTAICKAGEAECGIWNESGPLIIISSLIALFLLF